MKEARVGSAKSVLYVAGRTKIRPRLIKYIEENNWDKLPTLTVTLGLARNYAEALGVDPDFVAALVRRDYKRDEEIKAPNRTREFLRRFSWTPKTTLSVLLTLVVLVFAFYLVRQYIVFVSPPPLSVLAPSEGEKISAGEFTVTGETRAEASVRVNNQPADIDDGGNFKAEIELFKGEQKIIVESSSRSGKKTTVERKVFVE